MEMVELTGKEILEKAVLILGGRKAEDIKAIDIAGVSIIADYFLLASGTSNTQVRTLAEELEFKLSQEGINPLRVEGAQTATWIILDYGSVVIHIFHRDTRQFYNLERLWADGRDVDLDTFEQGKAVGGAAVQHIQSGSI
jgi:iojap-like ribosome-associated protein